MNLLPSPPVTLWIFVLTMVLPAYQSAAQDSDIRYYNSSWKFDDVDVGALASRLDRIGLRLPVDLEGKVTVDFAVGVPWNALTTAEAWRFNGTLTSSELAVSSLQFRDVQVMVRYADGVLALERLNLSVPSAVDGEGQGSLQGTARMELVPQGEFTSTVNLTDLPLSALGSAIAAFRDVEGRLSGEITASAPVDRLTDVTAWTMNGPVSLRELVVRALAPSDASAEMSLADGVLTARNFRFRLGDTQLTSGAAINLTGRQQWTVNARLAAPDLRDLLRDLAQVFEQPSLVQAAELIERGGVSATATLTGALDRPEVIRASGSAEVTSLAIVPPRSIGGVAPVRSLVVSRLGFGFRLDEESIELSQIDAALAGGVVRGNVSAPLAGSPLVFDFRWSGLQPSLIFAEPMGGRGPFAGSLSATIPRDALSDPSRWQLDLNASLAELTYDGWTLTDLQTSEITLRNGRLVVPNLAGQLEGEPLAISLDMQLAAPFAIESAFNFPSVQLSWLGKVPQVAVIGDQLDGVASVSGRISGAWKPLRLEGQARVRGENLRVAERVVDSLQLNIALDRDRLAVNDIVAAIYGGQLTGGAAVTLGEQSTISADVRWTAVDLGAAVGGIDLSPVAISGVSSGSVRLNIPAGALADGTQWTADGRMQVGSIAVYAWRFQEIAPFDFHLAEGMLRFPAISAQADGSRIDASVGVGMKAPWKLDVDGEWRQAPVEGLAAIPALSDVASELAGQIDLTTKLTGELSPLRVTAKGRASAARLTFNKLLVDRAEFAYDYRPELLRVTDLKASLGAGRLNGDFSLPLDERQPASANLNWNEIDVGAARAAGFTPFPLQGTTGGEASLQIPAGSWHDVAAWGIDGHLRLRALRSNDAELASLEINLLQENRTLAYDAAGRLLGGSLELSGNRPADAPAEGLAALGTARVSLRDANLTNVASIGQPRGTSGPVSGVLSISANSAVADGAWRWDGDVRLSNVQFNGLTVAESVDGRVSGSEDQYQIDSIGGRIAGGTLTGGSGQRTPFGKSAVIQIGIRGADIETLAELVTGTDSSATGTVNITTRLRPGTLWRIEGVVTSGRAELGGQSLRNARLPINVTWHPLTGRVELHAGDAYVAVAGGRITGRLTARRAPRWSVDGNFRFFRVNFASFAGAQYGRGRLSGTLQIGGRNVRSANDLTAVLQANLEDAQAANLPLVGQLRNYVPGMSSSATQFGEGRIEATLNRGVIRLEELSLASSQLQIYIEGRATLAGRLNLDGVVSTGSRLNPFQAQSLLTKFALNTVAPVTLLATANDFLSNRVVHVAITGTIRRPAIRLLPFESLREEVIRYFLRQAAGNVLPAGGAMAPSVGDGR